MSSEALITPQSHLFQLTGHLKSPTTQLAAAPSAQSSPEDSTKL